MKILLTNLMVLMVGIAFAISCEDAPSLTESELAAADTTLVGPTWQLVAFVDADGDSILVVSLPEWRRGYTVEFTSERRECQAYMAPCGKWIMIAVGQPNTGGFSYDLQPDENQFLTIYFHGQTKVGLPEGSKEPEFFDALKAASSYRINGQQLRIFYGDGNKLLFELKDPEEE